MKSLILLVSLCTNANAAHPIDTVPPRNYLVSLVTVNAEKKNGYLVDVGDSTISLAGVPLPRHGVLSNQYRRDQYAYAHIASMEVKRKGVVGRSMLWGTGAGLVVGAMGGFISGDDPKEPLTGEPLTDVFITIGNSFAMTAGEKAEAYGLMGAVTGAAFYAVFTPGAMKSTRWPN